MKLLRDSAVSTLMLLALGLAVLSLTGCGGGGDGANPPDDNPPAAVEELTEDDLTNAGIPPPPFGGASAVRSASLCTNEVATGWDAPLDTHNLEPLPEGGGFRVTAPDNTQSRILAWALYKAEGGPGRFLRELGFNIGFPPAARVFYAVGNFTRGRWEIGGRIFTDGFESGETVKFSNHQRYSGPNGDSFLLIVIANHGDNNVNGLPFVYEEIEWKFADLQCLTGGFGDEQQYRIEPHDGNLRLFGEGFAVEQRFPEVEGSVFVGLLLPAVQKLLPTEGEPHHFFDITYLQLEELQTGPGVLFYDPYEMNAGKHPFALRVMVDGQPEPVATSPLMDTDGNGTANGIIGILVALNHVVPGATVELTSITDGTSNTMVTDKRGRFKFDELSGDEFTLNASWQAGGEQHQLSAELSKFSAGNGHEFMKYEGITGE